MSSEDTAGDVAIRVRDVSKHFLLFDRPQDRLKQSIVPRLQRLVGRPPTRYYRDFAALSGVSFEVRRGETVGIVGRNGSGKSTLLQVVCGTLRPNGGSVAVNGRIAALLELGAGFNPEFTGRENVYLNAAILGLSREETDARFDDIARFADIGDFIGQPVKTYSSGMYVRLAFATAINVDPDILVVDEALSVGDEAFQRKCFARIEQIQERGGTILFVTHSAQLVVQLCNRALLMDRGELIMDGRPKAVTSQYQRLVNASPEAAETIRATILKYQDELLEAESPNEQASHGPAEHTASDGRPNRAGDAYSAAASQTGIRGELRSATHATLEDQLVADFFDPALVSTSTVSLEERGARVRDVRITTLAGERVNVLQMGKRYVLQYEVDFTQDATDVGFGMWIRTIEGFGLGGAQTVFSRAHRTTRVERNQIAQIAFEFSCIVLPGTYFFSCGLMGRLDSEEAVLHRLIDVLMFRVAPEPHLIATGRIDLGAQVTVLLS